MSLQINTTNRFLANDIYQMDAFWFRNTSISLDITYPSEVIYSEFEIDRFMRNLLLNAGLLISRLQYIKSFA